MEVTKDLIALAESLAVSQYQRKHLLGLCVEDFLEEAYIALVTAVQNYDVTKEASINTCVTTYIRSALRNLRKTPKAKSRVPQELLVSTEELLTDEGLDGGALSFDEFFPRDYEAQPINIDHTLDDILACCVSDTDCAIVRERMEDHTLQEIGSRIGISKQAVSIRLLKIKQRYYKKFGK